MIPTGRVAAVSVSNGGVPKIAVPSALVTRNGLGGDRQRHTRIHGGPERAVCLYSRERIDALRREGHPIDVGTTGENLTLSGLDWERIVPGVRLRVGPSCRLEIASYTAPCRNVAGSFRDGAFSRISQKAWPGWSRVYARVLDEGPVAAGDEVQLEDEGGRGDARR